MSYMTSKKKKTEHWGCNQTMKSDMDHIHAYADLQADCEIDPAAEGSADSTRVQPHILEELTEGLCQSNTRPLFCHNHT